MWENGLYLKMHVPKGRGNTTVYPKKYAHGFVVLCFVVVMQSFIMNSHEVFIHIHQGCFAGTGAIVRLPQCQWSKPDGYGKISQCIITTKHSKAKTVCIFLGIYCMSHYDENIVFKSVSYSKIKKFWFNWYSITYRCCFLISLSCVKFCGGVSCLMIIHLQRNTKINRWW